MPRIISVANQKGGVGKTTTAVNLAASLACQGHKTLLIDMDPQGNASSGLGFAKDETSWGSADALLGFRQLCELMLPVSQNLQLVPCTRSLVGVEVELVDLPGRAERLAKALSQLANPLDYVIVDCPPSLGLLTVNALAASHSVLVPLQAQYYAIEGLGELLNTIAAIKQGLNPRLVREGIVITMADMRTRLARDVEAQAREVFGRDVFRTVIPRNVRLAEAPSYGCPVQAYDPSCRGAQAYRALAAELIARQGASRPQPARQVAS